MGSGAGVMEAVPGRIKQLFNDGEGGDGRDGGSGQSVVAGEMTGEAGTRRLERLEQLFTDGGSGRKRFLLMTERPSSFRLWERVFLFGMAREKYVKDKEWKKRKMVSRRRIASANSGGKWRRLVTENGSGLDLKNSALTAAKAAQKK